MLLSTSDIADPCFCAAAPITAPDVSILLNRCEGFLGFAPRRAIHAGGPSGEFVRFLQDVTRTDNDGRRYYRRGYGEPWQRLAGAASFRVLNAVLDAKRLAA